MNHTTQHTWQPDESQQKVIGMVGGRHLVLAPPGCGKTQILAERVRHAHAQGVDYDDMLCLTFTNRAARGMRERIQLNIDDAGIEQIFVGNVHRFCSHFLFENRVVPAESAIIDEDTVVSILANYLQEDEGKVQANFNRRRAYSEIMFFSHLMEEIKMGLPRELRQHPDCATPTDVQVMRALCRAVGKEFTADQMVDIYEHNDYYVDVARSAAFDAGLRQVADRTLFKMKYAHAYTAYKQQYNLLDFEDLLIKTYATLRGGTPCKRYPWIQVDEVQDLNRLQLAIIDALWAGNGADTAPSQAHTLMFLGDEQQAIFSFMGAKLATLEAIKRQCKGSVHHLHVNHRSPKYLVDMLNRFAADQLAADPDLLPRPDNDDKAQPGDMQIRDSRDIDDELQDVARYVKTLAQQAPDRETTAVVVNSNKDADQLSETLTALDVSHFKVSGTDIFALPQVKWLLAHLSVLSNELNHIAWSQLLTGLRVCESEASARGWLRKMRDLAISPADFLRPNDDTYLQEFLSLYERDDIVVFDTETTGLNVFEDDIVQIAAEKIRQGRSVAKFSVYIETDRTIPAMLGDIANPIIEERRHHQIHSHADALRMFLDFVGDGQVTLMGHNAEYDYRIMDYNLRRYLPEVDWQRRCPRCFDTLKLMRLLRPDLKAYKLKHLLAELHLEGENSHLADDDVNATVSLVGYCYAHGSEWLDGQRAYLASPSVRQRVDRLRRAYQSFYDEARQRLYERLPEGDEPALVGEMKRMADLLKEKGWWKDVPKIDYVYRFLAGDIIDPASEPSLKEQLDHHVMELSTFKEADLCSSTAIDDRVFVSTIHKAKGLEFNNVVVFDVVDGRIPNFYNQGKPDLMAEDARKLYVAMSRAKKRLVVWWSRMRPQAYSGPEQRLSRFMDGVRAFFDNA